MKTINLVPWREEYESIKIKKITRLYYLSLSLLFITLLILHGITEFHLIQVNRKIQQEKSQLTHQKEVTHYLSNELKKIIYLEHAKEINKKTLETLFTFPEKIPGDINPSKIFFQKEKLNLFGTYEEKNSLLILEKNLNSHEKSKITKNNTFSLTFNL